LQASGRHLGLAALAALASLAAAAPAAPPPYDPGRPLPAPVVFAPGSISTGEYESHPAFTADGKTLYFLKNTPDFGHWTIVESRFEKGAWTRPEVVPFSGRYSDADPFLTSDGSRMLFISNRPVDGKAKQDLDIWVVDRKAGGGWGEPRPLGPPVSSPGNEWFPTLAADGTLYFGSDREGGKGRTDLYRARLVDGRYAEPENLGDAVNSPGDEFEPLISPKGDVLLFMAVRQGGQGSGDFWVSSLRDGAWTPARNLPLPINSPAFEVSPRISPDGRYFFFTSTRGFASQPLARRLTYDELSQRLNSSGNGLGDIYQVDLSALGLPSDQGPQ
jgi:Tol biopolymer transport system component